jgi:vanillate O-demethylase ferredoxin subunit
LLRSWLQALPRVLEEIGQGTSMNAWIDLKVKSLEKLTPDVLMIELVSPSGDNLPRFEAGSYIDIQLPVGLLRPYSLCNAPHQAHGYVIAVRRESNSRGASTFLHERLRPGDVLTVRHPINTFALHPSSTHSVLFGGGVGAAPLVSMAADLWRRVASFELHLSARNEEHAPFLDYLKQAPYRSRVHLHLSEGDSGRLDFENIFERVPPLSHFYLCGPARYMNAGISAALKAGVSNSRLHFESFDS